MWALPTVMASAAAAPKEPDRSPSDVNVILLLLIGGVAILAVVLLALAIAFHAFGL